MPQPLKHFLSPDSSYEISFDAACLEKHANLAVLIARAIVKWSEIDHALGYTLINILGAHAKPGFSMYSAIVSTQAKGAALKAAAESTLEGEKLKAFKVMMKISDTALGERNKLAHNVWGCSPQVPDGLLLIKPEYLQQKHLERSEISRVPIWERGKLNIEELMAPLRFDLSKIYVYKKGDFERILRDYEETGEVVGHLNFLLDPNLFGFSDNMILQKLSENRIYALYQSR